MKTPEAILKDFIKHGKNHYFHKVANLANYFPFTANRENFDYRTNISTSDEVFHAHQESEYDYMVAKVGRRRAAAWFTDKKTNEVYVTVANRKKSGKVIISPMYKLQKEAGMVFCAVLTEDGYSDCEMPVGNFNVSQLRNRKYLPWE